ncbi:COX17-domain-containing protein [Mycena haematopus]|nr:COX17-domain-containing protein [Mycena haematopus]
MLEKITALWSPKPEPPYDPTNPKLNPLNPQGLKPCCACPDTKSARDECFLKAESEADDKCKQLVANHVACMRSLGFKL